MTRYFLSTIIHLWAHRFINAIISRNMNEYVYIYYKFSLLILVTTNIAIHRSRIKNFLQFCYAYILCIEQSLMLLTLQLHNHQVIFNKKRNYRSHKFNLLIDKEPTKITSPQTTYYIYKRKTFEFMMSHVIT